MSYLCKVDDVNINLLGVDSTIITKYVITLRYVLLITTTITKSKYKNYINNTLSDFFSIFSLLQ